MKKFSTMFLVSLMTIYFSFGCTSTSKLINEKSKSTNNNIFSENGDSVKNSNEFSELSIKVSVKACPEDGYLIGSNISEAEKAVKRFLLNIDGQVVIWEAKGKKENKADNDGIVFLRSKKSDPEKGKGMRYALNKKISVKGGAHKVFFSLPGCNAYIDFPINLENGTQNTLEFKPVYRHTRLHTESFRKGISVFEVYLNGKLMPIGYYRIGQH